MVKLLDMPIECIHLILEHLDLYDVLELRLVSKRFKNIVALFHIKEFLVHVREPWSDTQVASHKGIYFHLNRPFNFLNVMDPSKMFLPFAQLIDCKTLRCLRFSAFNTRPNRQIDLHLLNSLQRLEYLEFHLRNFTYDQSKGYELSFPELRVLKFDFLDDCLDDDLKTLTFDTPRLEAYWGVVDIGRVIFRHAASILHLRSFRYNPSNSIFSGIQEFTCNYLEPNILLPMLEAHRYLRLVRVQVGLDYTTQLYHLALEVPRDRSEPRRPNLQIYARNIELQQLDHGDFNITAQVIMEQFRLHASLVPFYLQNFELLDNAIEYGVNRIEYQILMNSANHQLPNGFFNKFAIIRRLYVVGEIQGPELLINFIANCRTLVCLNLQRITFGQGFFDHLPKVSSLFALKITESPNVRLDDESFLGKMKHLRSFVTDRPLRISEALDLNTMKHLTRFCFNLRSNRNNRSFEIRPTAIMAGHYTVWEIEGYRHVTMHPMISWSNMVIWFQELATARSTRSDSKRLRTA